MRARRRPTRSPRSGTAPEDDEANIAWTRAFWERMKPHSDWGRIYLNFPGLGEEGEELVRRSYEANYL